MSSRKSRKARVIMPQVPTEDSFSYHHHAAATAANLNPLFGIAERDDDVETYPPNDANAVTAAIPGTPSSSRKRIKVPPSPYGHHQSDASDNYAGEARGTSPIKAQRDREREWKRELKRRARQEAEMKQRYAGIKIKGAQPRKSPVKKKNGPPRKNTSAAVPKAAKYVGVTYSKARDQWQARVCIHHRQHYCGRYRWAADAARAYDEEIKKLNLGREPNFKNEEEFLQAKEEEMKRGEEAKAREEEEEKQAKAKAELEAGGGDGGGIEGAVASAVSKARRLPRAPRKKFERVAGPPVPIEYTWRGIPVFKPPVPTPAAVSPSPVKREPKMDERVGESPASSGGV